ncbi:MAG: regulatory protein RecX [Candidatus Limnocylindria bacterium]
MEIATRFLSARPRSRWEIERRLARASVSESVIRSTVERLAELGYADDLSFARWWAEQRDRHAPRGRRLLEAELRRQGVPREVVEEVRDEIDSPERAPEDEDLPGSELERADDALRRHLRGRSLPDDSRALQRIGMYLMRRGFDASTTRAAIGALADPEAKDDATGRPD